MALNAADSLALIRDLTGDDEEPMDLTDEVIRAAITRRAGNLELAAADLRDLLESRTGSSYGPSWSQRTAEIRTAGSSVLDVGVRRFSSATMGTA